MNLSKPGTPTGRTFFTLALIACITAFFISSCKTKDYPRDPRPLGSGKVKWTESTSPDG